MQVTAPSSSHSLPNPRIARESAILRGRWLMVVQAAFLLFIVLAVLQLVVAGHGIDRSYLTEDTASWPRHDRLVLGLDHFGIPHDLLGWLNLGLTYINAVVAFGLALLLFVRKRGEPIALIVGIFLVGTAVATYPPDIADIARHNELKALLASVTTFAFPAGLVLLPFTFPDGRFVPSWTAIPVLLVLAGLAWTFFPVPREDSVGSGVLDAIELVVVLVLAVFSQIYRYRRASDDSRQRTRLFAIGLGMFVAVFVLLNVGLDFGNFDRADLPPTQAVIVVLGITICFPLVGLAFMAVLATSILRDQLFDIQVVLNRTLTYAGLTGAVLGAYLLVTFAVAGALNASTGGVAGVAGVGVATLAIYPVRTRLQRGVDRLVYGQRDDPYAVLSGLSRRFEGTVEPERVLPEIVSGVTSALKLPYAAITIDGSAEPVAASGSPGPIARRFPLVHQGEPLGELLVSAWPGTPLRHRDEQLLGDLAHQAGAAVYSVRLTHELQRSRERLVNAREEERRRLRRDLHDGLGPRLAGMMMRIDTIRDQAEPAAQTDNALAELGTRMADAIDDIRRVVYGLRPPALDDLGLIGALRQAAGTYDSGPMQVTIVAPETLPPLPAATEVAAFRIAQEAINNAAKHAHGRRCTVTFTVESSRLRLSVDDDGAGVAEGNTPGVGLRSMRERAEELGGTLVVDSGERGGTRVSAELPLQTALVAETA